MTGILEKYKFFILFSVSLFVIFLFFICLSNISFSQTLPTNLNTGLTSLALSNIYTSSGSDFLVIRVTGVGQIAATVTAGIRKSFDVGYIYVGAGSVPGQTVDFSQEDWYKNLVWQTEININLKRVGDAIANWWKSLQTFSNSSNNNNSSSR